jgi:hypothetical protein
MNLQTGILESIEMTKQAAMADFAMKRREPFQSRQEVIHDCLKVSDQKAVHRKLFIDFDSYTDGDREFKCELIKLMVNNIRDLHNSVKRFDFIFDIELSNKIVHQVKPTVCMLDDNGLLATLLQLQTIAQHDEALHEFIHQSLIVFEEVIQALENELRPAEHFQNQRAHAA